MSISDRYHKKEKMNEQLLTVMIAVITSISTLLISFLFKPLIEKRTHLSKVEIDHEYEQRKKIKEVLSKYKMHLINSADSLRGRLNNLSYCFVTNQHKVDGDFHNEDKSYFQSTIYRVLRFYAWMMIVEKKLIYLETTIASTDDLNFIKYIKAMKRTLQRDALVKGIQERKDVSRDMIFRDNLDEMCQWLIKEEDVISFSEFKINSSQNQAKIEQVCKFIDGISPVEDRRRWDRLYCLHLVTISFLNSYGYDYQVEPEKDIRDLIDRIRKTEIFPNLILHLKRYKLYEDMEVRKLGDILKQYGSQQKL
ncbi:MAG: hypothetical protein WBB45_05175 [Cyclobacteriaceae bacterium]